MQVALHHVPPGSTDRFVLDAPPGTARPPVALEPLADGRLAVARGDAAALLAWALPRLDARSPLERVLSVAALVCERLRVAPEVTARFRDAERIAALLVERVEPGRDRFGALWAGLSDARTPAARALRVATLIAGLVRQRGLARASQVQLVLAGLCLDLGATLLPDAATPRMRARHPQLSEDLLRAHGVGPGLLRAAVAGHHERIDGAGTPVGLIGPAVPFAARVTSLCDRAVDALVPPPIGPALPRFLALERLASDRTAFDPALMVDLVRLFARRDARW